ncbi:MAG: hypothetical protein K8I27_12365 [Planctomycetes bacterium]|nr:hypothetical protein [Planctomycetota bacterium]
MATRLVKRPKIDPRNASADPLTRLREGVRKPVMPVSFAQALNVLLVDQKRVNRSRLQRLREAWEMAVDQVDGISKEAAKKAEISSVNKTGAVLVNVSNPGLAHELGVVYREPLLSKLRELLHGKDAVSDLTVRVKRRAYRARK